MQNANVINKKHTDNVIQIVAITLYFIYSFIGLVWLGMILEVEHYQENVETSKLYL